MRFELKSRPGVGEARTKTQFLFFPKEINREVRWLEMATWKEKYKSFPLHDPGGARTEWVATKWIDEVTK